MTPIPAACSHLDIFPSYTREGFEAAFSTQYALVSAKPVQGSERMLYLMKRSAA